MKKHISAEYLYELGKGDAAKTDGFSEKFQKKGGGVILQKQRKDKRKTFRTFIVLYNEG